MRRRPAAAPSGRPSAPLRRLAALRGVAVGYEDAFGRARTVAPDTLVAVLAALGEPIARPSDAGDCLALRQSRPPEAPPAAVAWDGRLPADLPARLARAAGVAVAEVRLRLEDGAEASELLVPLSRLPFGLHVLSAGASEVLLVAAPRRGRRLEPFSWGIFAPTYALVDERRGVTGDLTCLAHLGAFAGRLGASYLATLPLLADLSSADSEAAAVSPYSPLSRMWWNEGYLDLARVAGVGAGELAPLARSTAPRADVAAAAAQVEGVLRTLMGRGRPERGEDYRRFCRERPDLARFAAFRAALRLAGPDRRRWPAAWAGGKIEAGRDVPAGEVELHSCAQWLTDEQVAAAAAEAEANGCHLMLDLPLGCRPDGYDTWAFPSSFAGGPASPAAGVSVGAPPDRFFAAGQDWGFRPLDPEGERRAGYPVVRGALSHHLRHARAVRIDHILGFQRLWWIPAGADPSEGAYVAYPAEELFALARLEAWRHDAALVGEDLGTVDPGIRRLMGDHGIAGMDVALFDFEARPGIQLDPPPGCCALVDTHDTPTLAGWLEGADIEERRRLGLLAPEESLAEKRGRSAARAALLGRLAVPGDDPPAVHAALLEELGLSKAALVMVALEDLWGEREAQNLPGTGPERPNFARRFPRPLSAIEEDDRVLAPLHRLDRARRDAEEGGTPRAGAAP